VRRLFLEARTRRIASWLCYHNPMDRVERRRFEWGDAESRKTSSPRAFGRHVDLPPTGPNDA
jgi:hypothetical protein